MWGNKRGGGGWRRVRGGEGRGMDIGERGRTGRGESKAAR